MTVVKKTYSKPTLEIIQNFVALTGVSLPIGNNVRNPMDFVESMDFMDDGTDFIGGRQ